MTLLASDAIAHIRHTLASEDVPSIGAYRILNDAGQYMVNMHNWRWCEGEQATLSLTANQSYVWLPEDRGEQNLPKYSLGWFERFQIDEDSAFQRVPIGAHNARHNR